MISAQKVVAWLLGAHDYRISAAATNFAREISVGLSDVALKTWIQSATFFEHSGKTTSFVDRTTDGAIRVSIASRLLAEPTSVRTLFNVLHSFGHVRQMLAGQQPAALFTRELFRQELDASLFAMTGLKSKRLKLLDHRYTWKAYLSILAFEVAFPSLAHLAFAVVSFGFGYGLANLVLPFAR